MAVMTYAQVVDLAEARQSRKSKSTRGRVGVGVGVDEADCNDVYDGCVSVE